MNQFESLIADFAKMTGLPLSPDAEGGRSDGGKAVARSRKAPGR